MSFKTVTVTLLLAGVGAGAIVLVPKVFSNLLRQPQVNQLLETRACRGCDLRHVDLKAQDLQGVNLEGANLEGADLSGAKLSSANLKRANLQRTNLWQADLGCATVKFDLKADQNNANVDLNVDNSPPPTEHNSLLNFRLRANPQGATMSFNLWGCADLEAANLQGATLPDGTLYR